MLPRVHVAGQRLQQTARERTREHHGRHDEQVFLDCSLDVTLGRERRRKLPYLCVHAFRVPAVCAEIECTHRRGDALPHKVTDPAAQVQPVCFCHACACLHPIQNTHQQKNWVSHTLHIHVIYKLNLHFLSRMGVGCVLSYVHINEVCADVIQRDTRRPRLIHHF
jgi:hypothetical protein